VQRALGDRAAAEAGDRVVNARRQRGERQADVLADDSARADRERLLDDDDPLRVAERLPDLVERIRLLQGVRPLRRGVPVRRDRDDS
jgi:hypothetical protein